MEERLTWFFSIIDKVSSPSKAMSGALGRVQAAMERIAGGLGPRVQRALSAVGDTVGGMRQGLAQLTGGISPLMAAFGGAAVVGLGVAGARFAAQAISMKENAMIAFETILKSKDAAQRVMANAIAFAAATPFDTEGVIAKYQKLLVAGFSEAEVNVVLAGSGDLGAAFGAEKQDQAIHAFQKIMAQGKLTGESMQMLGDAGINVGKIYEQLGVKFGTTAAGAQKMISAGQIGSREGIAAALNVVKETVSGGELGGMMAKQSKTLSGLWSTLTSRPFELVTAADGGAALDKVKAFLTELTNALDPAGPTGKRIMGLFSIIGDAFGSLVGDATKGNGIERTLNAILSVAEPLARMFTSLGKGFFVGLGATLGPVFDVINGMDPSKPSSMAESFATLGRILGEVTGVIVVGFGIVAGSIAGVIDMLSTLWGWIESIALYFGNIATDFIAIGLAIIDGIWTGLTQGWDVLVKDFANRIPGLPEAVKDVLGIRSPSRVFEEIGLNTAAGFNRGLELGDMQGAMNDNAAPQVNPAALGGGGRSMAVDVGGINVAVTIEDGGTSTDPAAVGSAVADAVESRMLAAMDRLFAQAG